MSDRKPISVRVRFEVFKRDGFHCRYCGATALTSLLTLDHVVAHSKGGTDDPSNLITACSECNGGKSDVPLDESRLSPAVDPAALREHAEQVRAYLDAARELEEARMDWRAYVSEKWMQHVRAASEPAEGFITTLANALANLGPEKFFEALEVVERKRKRGAEAEQYFCGVVRKMAAAKESSRG